ncbi:MAG: ribosomal protein [Verrucomicrobiota bacterium]|jgi:large subunit ribosomal protein L16
MSLMPKRSKFRKVQRGSCAGNSGACNKLDFGEFGLQILDRGWMNGRQIEACRVALSRHTKRRAKIWIRVFPDKPVSQKPLGIRMGSGKGAPDRWVAVVRPGRVLFEMAGCSRNIAREAMALAANKLGFRCRFLAKEDQI